MIQLYITVEVRWIVGFNCFCRHVSRLLLSGCCHSHYSKRHSMPFVASVILAVTSSTWFREANVVASTQKDAGVSERSRRAIARATIEQEEAQPPPAKPTICLDVQGPPKSKVAESKVGPGEAREAYIISPIHFKIYPNISGLSARPGPEAPGRPEPSAVMPAPQDPNLDSMGPIDNYLL